MRDNSKRFPVTVILFFLFGIISIYLNSNSIFIIKNMEKTFSSELLTRINRVLMLSAIFSLSLGLVAESGKWDKKKKILSYLGLAVFSMGYFYFYTGDKTEASSLRWMGIYFIGILSIFLSGYSYEDYERYGLEVIKGFFITFLYSGVLYLGVVGILTAIFGLFNIESSGEYYYNAYIIIASMFAPSLFISKIPHKLDRTSMDEISKVWKSLFNYIVIPLLLIYLIILYLYFIKILITREWPKNLVTHLVLWSSMVSLAVLYGTRPFRKSGGLGSIYRRIYPIANIPLLFMMFFASYKRINQYSWTENRYFIVILGVWILLMNLYFILTEEDNRLVLSSLVLVVIIALFSPINCFKIAFNSQNARFKEILTDRGLLEGGKLVRANRLDEKTKIELNNLFYYFDRNHDIKDLDFIPENFKMDDTQDYFGFVYSGYLKSAEDNRTWISYNSADRYLNLDIKDYSYLYSVRGYDDRKDTIGQWSIEVSAEEKGVLNMNSKSRNFQWNIRDLLLEKLRGMETFEIDNADYSFEYTDEDVSMKVIVVEFYVDKRNDSLNLDDISYILLIK